MDDALELLELLQDQKAFLRRVLIPARHRFEQSGQKMDLALFFLAHGWNACEMAKAATLLMEAGQPSTMPLPARAALASTFNLLASVRHKPPAPQKTAFEWEVVAGKLQFFIISGSWDSGRKPTPAQCRQTADKIRPRQQNLWANGDALRQEKRPVFSQQGPENARWHLVTTRPALADPRNKLRPRAKRR